MAVRGTFQKIAAGLTNSLSQSITRTGSTSGQVSKTVSKGKASTAFTKLSSSTGTITLAAGHGLTTGTYDIYWSGGSRRNVAVVVTGNSLAISGGAGTNLPNTDTVLVVSPQALFTVGLGDMSAVQLIGRKLIYSGAPPSINAILQLLDEGADYPTYLSMEPNASVLCDIEGGEECDLNEASYLNGIISNPSSVANATFTMSWITD